jgi:hypothetical protein
MKTNIIWIVLLFSTSVAIAQQQNMDVDDNTKDSIQQSRKITYFTEKSIDFNRFTDSLAVDTALSFFQNYFPKQNTYDFYTENAVYGSFAKKLRLEINNDFPIHAYSNAYQRYLYDFDDVAYYELKSPFSEMYYKTVFGTYETFNTKLYQNIGKNINLGFQYNTLGGPGKYLNQSVRHNNFVFNALIRSNNQRYLLMPVFIHNQVKGAENGGIRNDSIFENNIESNRDAIGVWLPSAQNEFIQNKFRLKQYFFLRKQSIPDSMITAPPDGLAISHSFSFENNKRMYSSDAQDSLFYENFYIDPVTTFDSLRLQTISNEFILSNYTTKDSLGQKNTQYYLKATHYYQLLSDAFLTNTFAHMEFGGGFSFPLIKSFRLASDVSYLMGDYADGDYRISLSLHKKTIQHNYGLSLMQKKATASYFDAYFTSNHFIWNRAWKQQNFSKFSAFYESKSLMFRVDAFMFSDYLYYNQEAMPTQADEDFYLLQAELGFHKKFPKAWETKHRLLYQESFAADYIRVPQLQYKGGISYSFHLFDKALYMQSGLDLHYVSSYYADAYMPATAVFYLQDDKKIDHQLFVDVYLGFKIKRARIFVKYAHANAGLFGYNYYAVPHYPLQDASINLGLSWMFYD